MPHYLLMASLFALAGGFMWLIRSRVAPRVLQGRQDAKEWLSALLYAGWVMILILLVNAQGFVKMALMDWEAGMGVRGTWLELLGSHLSVLAGTASLMWLVVRSLQDPAVLREPTPMLGASRVMVLVAEKMLLQFWWAALGFGVVFGYAAGPGFVLLLAGDLTLFWAVGRISLAVQRRRLQHTGGG